MAESAAEGAPATKAAKKAPAKKAPAKKAPAKKVPAKRTPAKRTPAKRTGTQKAATRKTPATRTSADQAPTDQPAEEPSSRRARAPRAEPPRSRPSAPQMGRAACQAAAELTGRRVEGLTGIRRSDDGWVAEVEVLELERIPRTTDVLAVYEVTLDADGEVEGYRRAHRYLRGSAGDQ